MTTAVLVVLSALVILVFGHRQFNQWTEAESKREASEPDLLAFAPPKSFTSFGRFTLVASLYCLTLLALYGVLLAIFTHPPLGQDFLKVAGVTPENAWLVSLFIVTGLSPVLPIFSSIEASVREVMHTWAVVPGKAHQMATEIASPSTRFLVEPTFLEDVVLPRVAGVLAREDFTEGAAVTPANKWARLNYLLFKYAPPEEGGWTAAKFRSPYTIRFSQDFASLQKEIDELAKQDVALLRKRPDSPTTLAVAEKSDQMLHRLYVLMSCRAFGATRSWEAAVQYFQRAYGITVVASQGAAFPSGPVFDALAIIALSVFFASFVFVLSVPGASAKVRPVVWALCALSIHALGVLIGWKLFVYRKKRIQAVYPPANRLSREYLAAAAVLGYSCALVPIWLTAMYNQTPAGTLLVLAGRAFQTSWPWALFGAATAVATYFHLGRTANSPATLRLKLLCAAAQGPLYVALALLILAMHNPLGSSQPLAAKLADPVVQLVLMLTALIGGLLGFFLPSVLHGHGDDRRGGVERYDVSALARRVVLTIGGRQADGVLQQIALTGCVVRFPLAAVGCQFGGYGTVTLNTGVSLPAFLVREVRRDANAVDIALRLSGERHFHFLPKKLRASMEAYLVAERVVPAAV